MTQNIQNLFKNLKNADIPAGLEAKILKNIALQKKWQAQKRLILADALTLGSLGAFIFVLLNFWNGIARSEFWSLAKLVFTDAGIVANHWMDFSFSLLETFPAAHAAVFLAPVFLLLLSANFYFKSANKNHTKAWV